LQDVHGLLALKAAVASPNCTVDPRVCVIFDTWTAQVEPCQVANCSACTLEHSQCGALQPGTGSPTCSWRYLECTNARVTRVLLGELA
jgi:hypothetical protein